MADPLIQTKELIISRSFDAPGEQVWQAWTEPARVQEWWGPAGFTSPFCKADLRPGGKYHFCMQSPQGQQFYSGGIYQEIVEYEHIICTDYFADEHGNKVDPTRYGASPDFPKESTVVISFEKQGERTLLSIKYTPTPAAYEAMVKMRMLEGWDSSLDKLEAYLRRES